MLCFCAPWGHSMRPFIARTTCGLTDSGLHSPTLGETVHTSLLFRVGERAEFDILPLESLPFGNSDPIFLRPLSFDDLQSLAKEDPFFRYFSAVVEQTSLISLFDLQFSQSSQSVPLTDAPFCPPKPFTDGSLPSGELLEPCYSTWLTVSHPLSSSSSFLAQGWRAYFFDGFSRKMSVSGLTVWIFVACLMGVSSLHCPISFSLV